MSLAYHCDRDGCDSWCRVKRPFISEWIIAKSGGETIGHFCTLDCLTHWAAANSEPTQQLS